MQFIFHVYDFGYYEVISQKQTFNGVKDTPQLSPTKTVQENKDQDQDQLPVNQEFILLELL